MVFCAASCNQESVWAIVAQVVSQCSAIDDWRDEYKAQLEPAPMLTRLPLTPKNKVINLRYDWLLEGFDLSR